MSAGSDCGRRSALPMFAWRKQVDLRTRSVLVAGKVEALKPQNIGRVVGRLVNQCWAGSTPLQLFPQILPDPAKTAVETDRRARSPAGEAPHFTARLPNISP